MKTLTPIAAAGLTLLIAMPAAALTIGLGADANASASSSVGGATVSAAIQARITKGKDRADKEIERRTEALNNLNTRVQAMVRLSVEQKNSIAATINSHVTALSALKAKIDADTDIETLKADIKSITEAYRIYLLILPQGHITVAADKIVETASDLNVFSSKLSTRLSSAQTAGKDVTALQSKLGDMNTKIVEATTEANAALALVAALTPDSGDETKGKANAEALKTARADVRMAVQALVSARDEARAIVKGLKAFHLEATASSTASTTAQ